jgi:hypothetical protein
MPALVVAPPEIVAAFGVSVWHPFTVAEFIDPAGVVSPGVEVIDGQMSHDAGQWPRTTATLAVLGGLTPALTAPPVSPYGGRVKISAGAVVGGVRYTYPVATLDVHTTTIERPSGRLEVECASHEARIDEDRYYTRDAIGNGLVSELVTTLARRTIAGLPVVNQLGALDLPVAANALPLDDGVWDSIEAVMNTAGGEAVFNAAGALVLRPTPVKASTPVQTFRTAESGPGATVTGYRSVRSWAPSIVVMQYREESNVGASRRNGVWTDTGPISGVAGPYGRHTEVTTVIAGNGKLPSQAGADRAAASLAQRHRGRFRTVEIRCMPAPWITPGDTVRVELLGGGFELLLVQSATWPLTQLDVMTLQCVDPQYTAT